MNIKTQPIISKIEALPICKEGKLAVTVLFEELLTQITETTIILKATPVITDIKGGDKFVWKSSPDIHTVMDLRHVLNTPKCFSLGGAGGNPYVSFSGTLYTKPDMIKYLNMEGYKKVD